jgi:anti-sigma factor RsiW
MMPRLPGLLSPQLVCQQAVELVTDYLEGALSRADRHRFDKHLVGCPHCAEYLAQILMTIRLTGRVTTDDLSPQMRADLSALYQRWKDDQDGLPGPSQS